MTLQELNDIEANRQRLARAFSNLRDQRTAARAAHPDLNHLLNIWKGQPQGERLKKLINDSLEALLDQMAAELDAEMRHVRQQIGQHQKRLDAYLDDPEPVMNFAPGSLPAERDPFKGVPAS